MNPTDTGTAIAIDMDRLPSAWLAVDDDGRIRQHNALLAQQLGRTGESLCGEALTDWLDAASRLMFRTSLLPALHSRGSVDEVSLTFETRGGPWSVIAFMRREVMGQRPMTTWLLTSAMSRLRVTDDLRRAQHSLNLMAAAILQCSRSASGELEFPYASEKLLDLLGVTPFQAATDPGRLLGALLSEDRARFEATLAEVETQGGTLWRTTFRARRTPQRLLELVARADTTGAVWHGVITDVTEREQLQNQLRLQAQTDALTLLPNRAQLMEALQRCIESDRAFAVLFMDFDRFKQVNDSLGHEAGDELLRHVARRLQKALRSSDELVRLSPAHDSPPGAPDVESDRLAARLGGDEFVVLAADMSATTTAQALADRLLAALSQPYRISGQEIVSSASVGIVLGNRQSTPMQLLRDADTAMYEAKRQGRARWVQFSADMHERVSAALAMEVDLREALRLGQLRVAYQPIVDIRTGHVTGVEALARWSHPRRGTVSPAIFIAAAEESGLIAELGSYILRLACQDYVGWQRTGVVLPARLSVNLSRAQLQDRRLADHVAGILEQVGMPCSALQLEVTESLAMQDDASRQVLHALRDLGVRLALDDFGTGHSSLSALKDLPVQQIKVDRSFVSEIETSAFHRALIQAALQMAHALSLELVAEGVETASQARLLSDLGCMRAQGYLYSRPLEAADLLRFLIDTQARTPLARRDSQTDSGVAWASHLRAHQVIVTDAQGLTVFVNAAFTLNTGYTLDDLRGRKPGQLLVGALTDPRATHLLREAAHSGTGCMGVEILNYRKNGTPFWVSIDIEVERDASGQIEQFVSIQSEITDRHGEREALVELRLRAEAALASGKVGLFEHDTESNRLQIDDNTRRMLGLGPEAPDPEWNELIERLTELAPDTRRRSELLHLGSGQRPQSLACPVRQPDGQRVELWVTVSRNGPRRLGQMVESVGRPPI